MRGRVCAAAALAAALVAASALAGCGRDSGGDDEQATAPVSEGKATGEITIWAMGTEGEKLSGLAQEFMRDNPEAKVSVTAVPWDAAHQKIASAIAAKQTPDMSMLGSTWMGEFAKTGALEPTPEGLVDRAAYFDGAWQSTVVDGKSYALPWYVETRALFYRKDLAAKAGVTAPATWEELTAFAKALKERGGAQWGIHLQPGETGGWQTFLPFAWSNGAELMRDDQFTLDTPEMTEALAYYRSFFAGGLAPTNLGREGQLEQGFVNGTIGSFVSGPWHVGLLKEQGGAAFADKFAVAPMPAKKTATSFIGGSGLAVFTDAGNRDGAWKFAAWLSRPEVQVKWYQTVNDLPAVKAGWQDPALAGDPLLAPFGEQLETTKTPPAISTWEQVAATLDNEVEKVCKTGADPAAALKSVQQAATGIGTGA
jgi:multiple sugar transport system substrate-binding protein